ncbi:MAG: FAD-dependent oxidoreductase [Verrucomicrobiota bacterium]|nr:FAD-dependent oxidoreductase [Verrucomicrobiota bacterium]
MSLSTPIIQAEPASAEADIVIYGGTSGGVIAAIQASQMGRSVILIEPGMHLGGLSSGGLGATDIGNKAAIGGLSREFYHRVKLHYNKPESWKWQKPDEYQNNHFGDSGKDADTQWTFEPHVAEAIFDQWVREAHVPVVFGERLDLKNGIIKEGRKITSIRMESGREFKGRVFIDASYEGDLLAKAGVSYHVGREDNKVYGETLNGVQVAQAKSHNFKAPVDPYRVPGNPASGLLPGVVESEEVPDGTGDNRVQAYNFRVCMTDHPGNQVPVPQPEGYDPMRYELFLRYLQTGYFDALNLNTPMPNRKTDINNHGGFSSDNIGRNYDYPDGDYATREQILKDHIAYNLGMWWFLQNDPRVPGNVREKTRRWALCKDEFPATGGWPHQLYVREARRMIGAYVMTEHNCTGKAIAPNSVGLAAYTMDSHHVRRYVRNGAAFNEGDVQVHGFPPYAIGYGSITPKAEACENLLVPVCLSASHIAFGSIRMEPVFMVLGQSAAVAAVHAIEEGKSVQTIDQSRLHNRLKADGQVLEWMPD